LCEIDRGRELLEAAFPQLPLLWLDTEESEGGVFWIGGRICRVVSAVTRRS
jgi:ribosomal protein L3 glutamine methyltransferase